MDGKWYKRCPRCGNYMTKTDPLELYECCACGWEDEDHTLFFCEIIRNYCSQMPKPQEFRVPVPKDVENAGRR